MYLSVIPAVHIRQILFKSQTEQIKKKKTITKNSLLELLMMTPSQKTIVIRTTSVVITSCHP